jgi:hypothetical protein
MEDRLAVFSDLPSSKADLLKPEQREPGELGVELGFPHPNIVFLLKILLVTYRIGLQETKLETPPPPHCFSKNVYFTLE